MIPALLLFASLFLGSSIRSGNFPVDLYGPLDTRMRGQTCGSDPNDPTTGPCIWGHADVAILPIHFHPPQGYRVHILAIRGDLSASIKWLPGIPPAPLRSSAWILGGFETPDQGGDFACDECARGVPLYVQQPLSPLQPTARAAFDYTRFDFTLGTDNELDVKVASFLNDTGYPLHVELTYTLQFKFEKELFQ